MKVQPHWLAISLLCVAWPVSAEAEKHWTGDVGFSYVNDRSSFVTRKLAMDADATYTKGGTETAAEAGVNRQSALLPGVVGGEVTSFKYDANLKWKRYLTALPYYGYVSPRIRHNNVGYFTSVQAMRVGGGRKIELDESHVELMVEVGAGYRFASLADHSRIQESLFTLSNKLSWEATPNLTLKWNLVHEQSVREKYQTALLELKDKFTEVLAVKYQITHKRTYPYDASHPGGELLSNIGLDYEL